jgi:hypothetical protein
MAAAAVVVDGKKRCGACKQLVAAAGFHLDSRSVTGLASACKPCAQARKAVSNAKHHDPKRKAVYARRYKANHPERHRVSLEKRNLVRFGLTLESYTEMHSEQRGVCAICGEPETGLNNKGTVKKKLAVDHCHASGAVRGLLCGRCNTALGLFKEDTDRLVSAINYLRKAKIAMELFGIHGVAHAGKDTAGAHLIDNHGYTRYGCADPVKEHAYLLDVRVNGTVTLSMLLEILDYDWDRAENHRVFGPEIKRTLSVYRDKLVHNVFGHFDRSIDELREDLLTLDPFLDGDVSMRTLLDSLGGDWELAKYHRFHGPEVRRHLQIYATEVCRDNFGQDIWVQLLARRVAGDRPGAVVITDVRFNEEAAWITANGGTIVEITRPGIAAVNRHISEAGINRKYIAHTISNDGTIDELADALDDVLKLTPAVLAAA